MTSAGAVRRSCPQPELVRALAPLGLHLALPGVLVVESLFRGGRGRLILLLVGVVDIFLDVFQPLLELDNALTKVSGDLRKPLAEEQEC